jgi:hypothetical protein
MRLARAKVIAKTGVLRQSQNAPAGSQPSACRVPVVFTTSDDAPGCCGEVCGGDVGESRGARKVVPDAAAMAG